jgi:hypothetical protein
MTKTMKQVLDSYEALPADEKQEVAVAILRRLPAAGDLSADDLTALADELFQTLDADEAGHARS